MCLYREDWLWGRQVASFPYLFTLPFIRLGISQLVDQAGGPIQTATWFWNNNKKKFIRTQLVYLFSQGQVYYGVAATEMTVQPTQTKYLLFDLLQKRTVNP